MHSAADTAESEVDPPRAVVQRGGPRAGADAGDFYTGLVQDSFDEQKRAMLAEGAAIIEIDSSAFAEKARDVMQAFESEGKWSAGLVEEIRALVN